MVFYFGACAGGVWKTVDGGTYWENVTDGFFRTAAVGAIAVSESDPNVIYAGTGESCIRGNVSHGDGVYRSTDAGKTWTHLGLDDTRHIARVRVHPRNPDLVYVAALGHAFGPNDERGVFRSSDGGGTWERLLFKSEKAGAIDLSMDASNPRVLYAAIWEALRRPWTFTSGGPDSGLYKSTDGGDTWAEITDSEGLPKGVKGRIGIATSPAQSDRVWAMVEAEEGGLFRSDNGGSSWTRVSEDRGLQQRPWYYSHVFADSQDPDTVFVLNQKAFKSTDGGRTFTEMMTPHGDNHDLWIDPRNPHRMIEGNDGGACVSFNGGETWSTIYNQPTSQFYHLATDNQFPYRVYATQQDNSAISVPSRSSKGAIVWADCYPVGRSESGHIAVRPDDPNIVYSGAIGSVSGGGDCLLRYDHRTGHLKIISVWPELYWGWGPKDHKHRFQWTYPIVISPHDPNILYVAGNMVFRSENEGSSWEAISPDLTRNDSTKMEASGGPITKDTTYVENYCTIFAFVESPHERGVFWAGSDDGLVHISSNGGETWENVTPVDLPEWTRIDMIEVSPHAPATAYMAATRYKLDDVRPFLYKTNDYGKTWAKITDGIPDHDFTRVIRADPERRGLLYTGTESGAYVSTDDGASWRSLQRNLPAVPVTDLVVKANELIASTNGRSFWILDDLAVLRQLDGVVAEAPVQLLRPAPAHIFASLPISGGEPKPGKHYMLDLGLGAAYYERRNPQGEKIRTMLDAGANPPGGVVVTYYLKTKPEGEVTLGFLDSKGHVIRAFSSKPPEETPTSDEAREPVVPVEAGMNRFIWDMRHSCPRSFRGVGAPEARRNGPLATPGSYRVRLTLGKVSQSQTIELIKDPRVSATQEELEEQLDLLVKIRDKLSETCDAINRIRSIRGQVEEWAARSERDPAWKNVTKASNRLKERLTAVEEELVQVNATGENDRIGFPARLERKLSELTFVAASSDGVPTKQTYEVFSDLSVRVDTQLRTLEEVIETDLAAFTGLISKLEIPAVTAK
jgi:photosystem II stability/assembly factor-like uncharacterized protein